MQNARTITRRFDKRQLRIICRIEPRTTRRILQAGNSEEEKQKIAQVVAAAGRRLTLQPQQGDENQQVSRAGEQASVGPNQSKGNQGQPKQQMPKTDKKTGTGKGKGHTGTTNNSQHNVQGAPTTKSRQSQSPTVKVTKQYALIAAEWKLPLRELSQEAPLLVPDQDGIYMTDNEQLAKRAAYEASHVQQKVALVTPSVMPSINLGPKHTVATLVSETLTDRAGQRTRVATKCRTSICVYNVSKQEAFQGQIMTQIKIKDDTSTTTVFRLQCDVEHVPKEAITKDLRDAVRKELEPLLEQNGIIDLWRWRLIEDTVAMGFIRIPAPQTEKFLQASGKKGIWIDTPVTHRHLFTPLWLSKPKDKHLTERGANPGR